MSAQNREIGMVFPVEKVNVADGAAVVISAKGVTQVIGADIAGDCTSTLADGNVIGEMKVIEVTTAVVTSDFVVTVTTGLQVDCDTVLATLTFNALGEYAILQWRGAAWVMLSGTATVA